MSVKQKEREVDQQATLPRTFISGIRDNHSRGSVGEFLRDKIKRGAKLSVVSAYFTIYAFEALKSIATGSFSKTRMLRLRCLLPCRS